MFGDSGVYLNMFGDSGVMILTFTFNRNNISYSLINSLIESNKTILELELFNSLDYDILETTLGL